MSHSVCLDKTCRGVTSHTCMGCCRFPQPHASAATLPFSSSSHHYPCMLPSCRIMRQQRRPGNLDKLGIRAKESKVSKIGAGGRNMRRHRRPAHDVEAQVAREKAELKELESPHSLPPSPSFTPCPPHHPSLPAPLTQVNRISKRKNRQQICSELCLQQQPPVGSAWCHGQLCYRYFENKGSSGAVQLQHRPLRLIHRT